MRTGLIPRATWLAVAVGVALWCAGYDGNAGPIRSPAPAWPQRSAQSEPHRCHVCNGTGNITQSYSAPLPERHACTSTIPNWFTGERGQIFTIANDADVGGTFTARVTAIYPGGGRTYVGGNEVYVEAHQTGTTTVGFTPAQGMVTATCEVTAPTVVQQRTAICPECHGRGFVR